jgi:recombinational DNA repair protein (RecF pathway)
MTNYKEVGTEALLIIESGLNYYDAEIMQELADRAGLTETWEAAEMYQEFEEAYIQIIMKLTR